MQDERDSGTANINLTTSVPGQLCWQLTAEHSALYNIMSPNA